MRPIATATPNRVARSSVRRLLIVGCAFFATGAAPPASRQEVAMMEAKPRARVDHVLIGAADLAVATEWFARAAGVEPVYGGKHPVGTHNALVSLGEGTYLELIAPQPGRSAESPFGDLAGLRSPRPIGFAVAGDSVTGLQSALRAAGFASTDASPGSRTTPAGVTLSWQTFKLVDHFEPAPFFIVWSAGTAHPSTTSPQGCSLARLAVAGPKHAEMKRLFGALDLDVEVSGAERPTIEVDLSCPTGKVRLQSELGRDAPD